MSLLTAFHDELFPATCLSPNAAGNLHRLASMLQQDPAMKHQRWRAYALATVRTECGPDFAIRTEQGPREYFAKYEPGTTIGVRLGNFSRGDGYKFRGRGFVQISGRRNYVKFSPLVGYDLVADPEAALVEGVAYQILSIGMTQGLFTGKKLGDYLDDSGRDYTGARRIINGQNRAALIAADAVLFERILRNSEVLDASRT